MTYPWDVINPLCKGKCEPMCKNCKRSEVDSGKCECGRDSSKEQAHIERRAGWCGTESCKFHPDAEMPRGGFVVRDVPCGPSWSEHRDVFDALAKGGAESIRSRIMRQQQRIVTIGEQIGALMLSLEAEEDFMAELLAIEEKEFQENEAREEHEAREHGQPK